MAASHAPADSGDAMDTAPSMAAGACAADKAGRAALLDGLSPFGHALDALRLPGAGAGEDHPLRDLVLRGFCVQRDPDDFDGIDLDGSIARATACAAATAPDDKVPIVRAEGRVVEAFLASRRAELEEGMVSHKRPDEIISLDHDGPPLVLVAALIREKVAGLTGADAAEEIRVTLPSHETLVHLSITVDAAKVGVVVTVVCHDPIKLDRMRETLVDDAWTFIVLGAPPSGAEPRVLTQSRDDLAALAALARAIDEEQEEEEEKEEETEVEEEKRSPTVPKVLLRTYGDRVEVMERRHAKMEAFFHAMLQPLCAARAKV